LIHIDHPNTPLNNINLRIFLQFPYISSTMIIPQLKALSPLHILSTVFGNVMFRKVNMSLELRVTFCPRM
jgi:hypothetical protein